MLETLIISPKFSKWLFALLLFEHLGAMICIWILSIAIYLKIIGILLIIFYFYYLCYMQFFNRAVCVTHVIFQADNWWLYFKDGRQLAVDLQQNKLVNKFLIILHFKSKINSDQYTVLLFSDSETKEKLRRLRFILLYNCLA